MIDGRLLVKCPGCGCLGDKQPGRDRDLGQDCGTEPGQGHCVGTGDFEIGWDHISEAR